MTSFGIEFKVEESEENERSPNVAFMCVGLLCRGMACELERVFQVCECVFSSIAETYDGAVLL